MKDKDLARQATALVRRTQAVVAELEGRGPQSISLLFGKHAAQAGGLFAPANSWSVRKKRLPVAMLGSSNTLFKGYPEYNPDQPRDEDGQFSESGGGSSGSASAGTWKDAAPGVEVRSNAPKRMWPWKAAVAGLVVVGGVGYLVLRSRTLASRATVQALAPYVQVPVKRVAVQSPLGRRVALFTDGQSPKAQAGVLAAIDLLPKAHYNAIRKSGLRFVTVNNLGPLRSDHPSAGALLGYYRAQSHAVIVPEMALFAGRAPKPIGPITMKTSVLHEIAHALDWGGTGASRVGGSAFAATMGAEFAAFARTPGVKEKLAPWFKANPPQYRPREMFAEMYSARYMPSGQGSYFWGGISQQQVRCAFPQSLKNIDGMKNLTPGVFSRLRHVADSRMYESLRNAFGVGAGIPPGLPPRPFF